MKRLHYSLFILPVCLISCAAARKSDSDTGRIIYANKKTAYFSVSGEPERTWNISPHIERDTLTVTCYEPAETLRFRTDRDSLRLQVRAGQTIYFTVRLPDSMNALTVVHGVSPFRQISFGRDKVANDSIRSWYGFQADGYRDSLRNKYPYTPLSTQDDISRIAAILDWTHRQWKHNGGQSPKKNDAISILDEVKTGGRFPCFAYSIVLAARLNEAGYPARVLYLKGSDVETNKVVPGHVVTEAYIPSLHKWAFLDGQFNAMPMLNGRPLNAVEFQQAATRDFSKLTFYNGVDYNGSPMSRKNYAEFVYPYLFFFDYYFDSRSGTTARYNVMGKQGLMLVPKGVKPPEKFGAFDGRIDYVIYTNDEELFYRAP